MVSKKAVKGAGKLWLSLI